MEPRHRMVVFDCADPERVVEFWRELTGAEVSWHDADWCSLKAPAGGIRLGFQRVPEPKAVKNRVHLDLDVDDLAPATERAEALGAARLGDVVEEDEGRYQVMTDIEGNEFCLIEEFR